MNTPGFDATEISEVEKGGPHESDADEAHYMKDEFTQQEFHELGDLQESGALQDGTDDQKKYAAAAEGNLRRGLIRCAATLPKGAIFVSCQGTLRRRSFWVIPFRTIEPPSSCHTSRVPSSWLT